MRKTISSIIYACCLCGLLALGWSLTTPGRKMGGLLPRAHAQEQSADNPFDRARTRACTLGGLRGSYGVKLSGSVVGLGPIAEIGAVTFDGAGNFTGALTASFNGQIVPRTALGTTTLNADCSGSFTVNLTPGGTIHLNLVVVDEGKEIFFVGADQGTIFSGTLKRM